jgi:hypothetical protein
MLCAVVPVFWPFLLKDVIRAPNQAPRQLLRRAPSQPKSGQPPQSPGQ